MSESFNVPLSNLVLSKLNARSILDQKTLEAMAGDMRREREAGRRPVMMPLLVRSMGPEGAEPTAGVVGFRYEVICGSRRLAAGKLAELDVMPVTLEKLTDSEALSRIAHENHDREDFHFLDRAEAWKRWRDAGASADQIAAEMQCKRAWVYSTINLTQLTPEVKRACWDSRVPESAAHVLATVPPKLQGLAMKAMLAPGPDSKPLTVREMIDLIRTNWRLDLKKMPFDTADKTLIPKAGDCETCQFRSGVQPELLSDAGNDYLCTNPPCCAEKNDAQWARRVDDGEHGRGPHCLPDKEAKGMFTEYGLREDTRYVRADSTCHEDMKGRSFKALLGPVPDKHIVLARNPATREVVELLSTATMKKTLDEAGVIKRRVFENGQVKSGGSDSGAEEEKLSKEEKKALAEKQARRDEVTRRVVGLIAEKMRTREPDKKYYRMQADALVRMGGLEEIWKRRDVQEEPSKYLDRLDGPGLRAFVDEALFEFEMYQKPEGGRYPPILLERAKFFGIEIKESEREVIAEEKAKPEVRKGKEKKS